MTSSSHFPSSPETRARWILVQFLALLAARAPEDSADLEIYEEFICNVRGINYLLNGNEPGTAIEILLIMEGMALGLGLLKPQEISMINYDEPGTLGFANAH